MSVHNKDSVGSCKLVNACNGSTCKSLISMVLLCRFDAIFELCCSSTHFRFARCKFPHTFNKRSRGGMNVTTNKINELNRCKRKTSESHNDVTFCDREHLMREFQHVIQISLKRVCYSLNEDTTSGMFRYSYQVFQFFEIWSKRWWLFRSKCYESLFCQSLDGRHFKKPRLFVFVRLV